MEWTFKSDIEILEEIGRRIQTTRLERNVLQKDLAAWAGVSLTTLQRLEGGKSINTMYLVKILRALDMLEKLGLLFSEPLPSPILMKKQQGGRKFRARNKN